MNDPLERRVIQLNGIIDGLRRELAQTNRPTDRKTKKSPPAKERFTLDNTSLSRVTHDVGKPGIIAGGMIHVVDKICRTAGGNIEDTWVWVMEDPTINGWIMGGLISGIALVFKFTQRYHPPGT